MYAGSSFAMSNYMSGCEATDFVLTVLGASIFLEYGSTTSRLLFAESMLILTTNLPSR